MSHVLAIDQGTSGTKAVVVRNDGSIVSVAEETLSPSYGDAGAVEQDPTALFTSVLAAGSRAVADAGVPIDAVAVANQGETVLAWDRHSGRPLSPAVVWQDRRSEQICEDRRRHAERIASLTGLVLDPYFSAPKMRWIRDHVTSDGVVTTTDTWIVHQLCGAFVTDASTASRSLLLDLDEVAWSDELLGVFGLADEAMPEIVACDTVVGTTNAFGRPAPVTGLVVDQQAALFGEACTAPGTAKCTYGTGAFLLANTGAEAVRSGTGSTTSVAWRLRGTTRYCLDGQVYTAASAVRWLTELGIVRGADELDTVAAASSDGVLCVPALAGLAAPWWDATATASLSGMTLGSGRGQVVRAVLEGIAAQVAVLVDLMAADLGAPMSRLRVDGGLTRSSTLMQAQADLAQVPIEVYPHPHATAFGAAALAHLAIDPSLAVDDVVAAWVPSHTYEPAWSADRASEHMDRWRRAADATLGRS